ncbi:MAG TPA: DUF924 family protein [Burkholderiaceae bacterium]|jgi:uncharacterized protein (DUF924 family)|nr:DUF924 family protein [Burkholderiaceae bacterium]
MIRSAEEVIRFWFQEISPKQWWAREPAFDGELALRFGATHAAATRCELYAWREQPAGRLAEVVVLDQFSRNIHRDDPRSFAFDQLALGLAQEAVRSGADQAVPTGQRVFLYMPFMHSESAVIHEWAMTLFSALGSASNLASERRHKQIIDRFGRYPHRNRILGRPSTPEEVEYLAQDGSF